MQNLSERGTNCFFLFHFPLFRQEQASKALQLEIQSLFELRMALKEEKDNQEKELKKMQFEDVNNSFAFYHLSSSIEAHFRHYLNHFQCNS